MGPVSRDSQFPLAFIALLALLSWPGELVGQDTVSGDSSIVIPGSRIELIFDGAYFTEGPAVGPDGSVYFSDITVTYQTDMEAGHIWRFDPTTGQTSIFRSPSGMANGIIFDLEDRMVVAEGADFGGRRVTRTDMKTGRSEILADLFNGRHFNAPNDLTIDGEGNIYFTDPRYLGHEPIEQPVQGVYRIDPNGSVSLVIADAGKPNGILVSPDQRTLYVASLDYGTFGNLPQGIRPLKGRHALLAYDLQDDGTVPFREEVIDFSTGRGPDGMTIDVDGNLYITQPRSVTVYSPEGKELALIPVPNVVRNVTFGRGETKSTLYITAGGFLYRLQVQKTGYHPR